MSSGKMQKMDMEPDSERKPDLRTWRAFCTSRSLLVAILLLASLAAGFVLTGTRFDDIRKSNSTSPDHVLSQSPTPQHKSPYAFATFVSAYNETGWGSDGKDQYFEAARLINYQLQHSPSTRSDPNVPFLVMVADGVAESKRQQLTDEGVTVVTGQKLTPAWAQDQIKSPRWGDVMLKLNFAKMTEYEKICFIDADTMIFAPLDDIFYNPALDVVKSKTDQHNIIASDAPQPTEYMFAAVPDRGAFLLWHLERERDVKYFNAGFFCLHPSVALYEHYLSVLNRKDSFMPSFPEQNLLNQIHRPDGNMPWRYLDRAWNTNVPSAVDLVNGTRSFHSKLWLGNGTPYEHEDPVLARIWEYQKRAMDKHYQRREQGPSSTRGHVGAEERRARAQRS